MGDGYQVSPTDLLHASQTLDSAVDQLRAASDQINSAELPDWVLGTDKYLAAITAAWNKAVDARKQDVKLCAEFLDGMIEALGDTLEAYHKNEAETADRFGKVMDKGFDKMAESGEDYDPMTPPELDGNGDVSGGDGAGAGADVGADSGASGNGATESGGASEAGGSEGSGPSGGACGEHPLSED